MAGKLILTCSQQSRSDQNMKQTPNIKAFFMEGKVSYFLRLERKWNERSFCGDY